MNNEIQILCPATVANVSCGYDVLGFCLDDIGDLMTVAKTQRKGLTIVHTDNFGLPTDPTLNVAGISALAMLKELKPDCGFKITIQKNIKPGSGIGSSSASATGSVFAINELLGRPLGKNELVRYAIEGEKFASKCLHADNLAPAIYGGFTLVKNLNPLEILQLPTPPDLFAIILHPQIEVKTSDSKNILPSEIPMKKAIEQWANVGSLVHALHTNNYSLLGRSLVDVVAEPYRSKLIPGYNDVKNTALQTGALGCGISGSGPSIYALCKSKVTAELVETAMRNRYKDSGIDFETYISPINTEGIKICQ